MMDKIFSRASQVVVWLGEPPAGQDLPLDLMQLIVEKIYAPIYLQKDQKARQRIWNSSNEQLQESLHFPPPKATEWESIRVFLRNDWFQRTWTFRELIVARSAEIRYGNNAITCGDTNSLESTTYTLSFQAFMYGIQQLELRRVSDAISTPFT